MKKFDLIIVGFGKGGKTLAKYAAAKGDSVAMIEQSSDMYGGTCINIGCIPSKTLLTKSLKTGSFEQSYSLKRDVVAALNEKNYKNLADDDNIVVIDAQAYFKSDKVVGIRFANGEEDALTAEHIVINTGALPVIPDIKGVSESKHLYDSTGIMNLANKPERLVIVGGGYIALEFATIFANLGTSVTVLEMGTKLMPREDQEIVELATKDMLDKGIDFRLGANVTEFIDQGASTLVKTTDGDFTADAVLLGVGRKANTADLGLQNTSIEVSEKGEIKVDEHLETTAPNVYAIGDVKGGLQFTYISLDDYRIVKDSIYSDGEGRTTNNRGAVPYTVFLDPPLARVGMTAVEAAKSGFDIVESKLPVSNIPMHKIIEDTRGIFKIVCDKKTGRLLGASLYGEKSSEIINILKMAIDQGLNYEYLRDSIYTHPTMAESFNDLFNL